jgi:type VI secretion system protein ImpM
MGHQGLTDAEPATDRRRATMTEGLGDARMSGLAVQWGFFGKIPARGDFVRAGLPRGFVAAWDDWLQHVMHGAQIGLGDAWLPAWMEAPIWRFRLEAGLCGADAAIGLFMPSVDRAGRHFPLTLACVARQSRLLDSCVGWIDQAEEAGIAALEDDLDPEALTARLTPSQPAERGDSAARATGSCRWWTDGAPRVPATTFTTAGLPDAATFARMLDARDATIEPI